MNESWLHLLRMLAVSLGVGAAVAFALYIGEADCDRADHATVLAWLSVAFGIIAFGISLLRLVGAVNVKFVMERPYILELVGVIASAFYYFSLLSGYTVRFSSNCTGADASKDSGMRDAALALPVAQTAAIVAFAGLAHRRANWSACTIAGLAAAFGIASLVLYYMHGGKIENCGDARNLAAQDEFKGTVWVIAVSSILLFAAYLLQYYNKEKEKRAQEQTSTLLWGTGGTALTVATYFLVSLIVDDSQDSCPFILDSKDRELGSISMYLIIAAMALQHTVPVYSKMTDHGSEYEKVSDVERQRMNVFENNQGGPIKPTWAPPPPPGQNNNAGWFWNM